MIPVKFNYPLLIDGGLSNELERQGEDLNHKLWSAKLIITNPEAIIKTHLAYLRSGATCISTASYQATIPGLMECGYTEAVAEEIILRSVQLAEKARASYLKTAKVDEQPVIAASIGPYGAYLADGSEYRGNYGISTEQLKTFHQKKIELLENSNADILAFETIPSFMEARVIATLIMECKKPSWVSFSCKDENHINDGTPIEKCAALFSKHPTVFAIGVNCTAPRYVSGLIRSIKKECGRKKIIVYPNSGEVYNADSKTWLGLSNPTLFVTMTKEWKNIGAHILGGCCRIGPEHIKGIKEMLMNE